MVECGGGRGINSHDHRSNAPPPPEAVLEGLAVAGLVGILRQLGDLAELAADVLDDLQGQVTATSARGRRLAVRAKRLEEARLPPPTTEDFRSSMNTLPVPPPPPLAAAAAGPALLGWRADNVVKQLVVSHAVVAGGAGMPRLLVAHIKRCRRPPALSALDRFDAHGGGEGACLKRYTDPSFFRTQHSAASAKLLLQEEEEEEEEAPLLLQRPAADPSSEQVHIVSSEFDEAKEEHLHHQCRSAGSDSDDGGTCSELLLERTSSFEAWLRLPPDADARFFSLADADRRDDSYSCCYETRDQRNASTGGKASLSEMTTACKEGARVDGPQPLLPPGLLPPMQWLLPKKIRIRAAGPRAAASSPSPRLLVLGATPRANAESPEPEVDREEEARSDQINLRAHEQAQADTSSSFQLQQGNYSGYGGSSSAEKKSQEEHVVISLDSSNMQKENDVFFSAVQELAKMSPSSLPPPPPDAAPVPPRPKHSSVPDDAGSQLDDRITLRNGPSLIHPSRNILDSRSVLLEQIKNKCFSLKPAASPFPAGTGSPAASNNSRVATILQRADDIRRQAHADRSNDDVGWSDDGE